MRKVHGDYKIWRLTKAKVDLTATLWNLLRNPWSDVSVCSLYVNLTLSCAVAINSVARVSIEYAKTENRVHCVTSQTSLPSYTKE